MGLSNDLISQFVKVTKDNTKQKTESTVYGETVYYKGETYVKLDGSELLTPVKSTTDTIPGDRVAVMIKDHTATITGNLSSPSARKSQVDGIGNKISEFEIVIADKVSTKELDAERGRIDDLISDNVFIKETLTAHDANITNLTTDNATINEKLDANEADISKLKTDKLDAEYASLNYAKIDELKATDAKIGTLQGDVGEFKNLTTTNFAAVNGLIDDLEANKLSAKDAELTYVNINWSNIGKTEIGEFFAKSGIINNVIVGDETITGKLVGVTISGDLIEGNTIVAEKLVIKGEDGLYYKLNTDGVKTETEQTDYNSINGTVIKAKSITATKIDVKDLVAFDATIGGFKITNNAIYSGVKESVNNTTRGAYLDSEGQVAFGDASNFIKGYKDQNGDYKIVISADSLTFGSSKKNIENAINEINNKVDNISLDGVSPNILTETRRFSNLSDGTAGVASEKYEGFTVRYLDNTSLDATSYSEFAEWRGIYPEKLGDTYIFSFYAKGTGTIKCYFYGATGYLVSVRNESSQGAITTNADGDIDITLSNEWTRYWIKFTLSDTGDISIEKYLHLRLYGGNIAYICGCKLEIATEVSDWSPAPKDSQIEIDDAQESADNAQSSVDDVEERVATTESSISVLSNSISSLVVDENGESLMEQTSDGWRFNMSSTIETITGAKKDIDDINGTINETISPAVEKIGGLEDTLKSLESYIDFGTRNGEPYIELGNIHSDFKVIITNTSIQFTHGTDSPASIKVDEYGQSYLEIDKANVTDELQFGGFALKERANGNVGFVWKGDS